jgi:hypothetical protein
VEVLELSSRRSHSILTPVPRPKGPPPWLRIGFQQKSAAPVVAEVVKDAPTVVEMVANATATANTVVH